MKINYNLCTMNCRFFNKRIQKLKTIIIKWIRKLIYCKRLIGNNK